MTNSTLPVSRVVSVSVSMSPTAARGRNFGAMLMLGASDVIDTDERIRIYSSIDDIATDFGVDAPEYKGAQAFFAQSPQPTTCYVGRWAKTATNGLLKGRILALSEQQINLFTSIQDGAFDVTIDGSVVNVTDVDLQSCSNLNAVASAVTEKLQSKGTCNVHTDPFSGWFDPAFCDDRHHVLGLDCDELRLVCTDGLGSRHHDGERCAGRIA